MKKKYIIIFIISISLIVFFRTMSFWNLEELYHITESYEYNDIKRIEYFASGSYILVDKDDVWYSIVYDWKKSKKYEDIPIVKHYQDWKNYSFVAKIQWKYVFVKDWIESQKYDQIYDFDISNDWNKYIFSALKEWKKIIVMNWFESEAYDEINDLDISEYIANYTFNSFIVRKNNNYLFIKDWVEQKIIQEKDNKYIYTYKNKKYEYDFIDSIKLIQWWKSYIFVAKKSDKYVVVKEWKEIWSYDNIIYNMNNNVMSNFDISGDKNSFTFIATKDKKQILIKDWFESEKYDKINNLIINSGINIPIKTVNHICYWYLDNAKSYIFKAFIDWKQIVVKDWIESEKYDKISDIFCFNNNYSYVAEKEWKNVLINNWNIINEWIKKSINYLDWKDYIFNDWFGSYLFIDWLKSKKYLKISWFKYFTQWNWFSFVAKFRSGEKVITYTKK